MKDDAGSYAVFTEQGSSPSQMMGATVLDVVARPLGRAGGAELFKVIQNAVLLILLYSTMLLFRATSSSTFTMSEVQSICIPLSFRD